MSPEKQKLIDDFMSLCRQRLKENPDDNILEEATHEDILRWRNGLAEQGLELTPQEVENAVELLKHARRIIRDEN